MLQCIWPYIYYNHVSLKLCCYKEFHNYIVKLAFGLTKLISFHRGYQDLQVYEERFRAV